MRPGDRHLRWLEGARDRHMGLPEVTARPIGSKRADPGPLQVVGLHALHKLRGVHEDVISPFQRVPPANRGPLAVQLGGALQAVQQDLSRGREPRPPAGDGRQIRPADGELLAPRAGVGQPVVVDQRPPADPGQQADAVLLPRARGQPQLLVEEGLEVGDRGVLPGHAVHAQVAAAEARDLQLRLDRQGHGCGGGPGDSR
mmetsp:Transcript_5933/g.17748  ORF Transcript_5933/g.17748 Transcript_5933/m.17748 type:complete len:200 (-) Transcript_5933:77-676(-)